MLTNSNFHPTPRSKISSTKDRVTFPNTEKSVENTTCSGVVLTNFEVFGNVVKHCLECLIYLLYQNKGENGEIKS